MTRPITLPTGRAGQISAVGLTLLVIATFWLGIAEPLIGWYADRADTLTERASLLRRMDELAATVPTLQRQAAAAPTGDAGRPDTLLQATSDATAGAELQQLVQDLAVKAGVILSSVETLTGRQDGRFRQIALHVSATATWAPLVQMLAAIERANPRMSLDDLQLRSGINLAHPDGMPITAGFSVVAFRGGDGP